jgi:hypothetical protein
MAENGPFCHGREFIETKNRGNINRMKGNTKYDNLLRKITHFLAWIVFFSVPFLGGNHLALPYITIDRFWIETTFLLLLAGSILCTFLMDQKTALSSRSFYIFFGPYVILTVFSLIFTWNFFNTLKEINILVWIIGIVCLYSISHDKDFPLQALVWGSVAVVICAILQAKILYPQLTELFSEGQNARLLAEKPVPFVAFLNENMFGGFLTLILPISVYLTFTHRKMRFVFSVALIISGILLSLSRLSLIVMVFESVIVFFVFLLRRKWYQNALFLSAATAGLVIFLLVIHIQSNASERRLEASFSGKASTAVQQAKTLNLRTSTWMSGFRAFKEQPLIGYGAGSFEYAYRKYFGGRLYTRYSHGSVVKIMVEIGAIGLASFLWFLLGVVKGAQKRRFRPVYILLSITGGFLFSMVDCAFDTPAFLIAFFLISSTFFLSESLVVIPRIKTRLLLTIILILISFGFTGKINMSKKAIETGESFVELGNLKAAIASYEEAYETMPIDNEGFIRMMTLLTRMQTSELSYSNSSLLNKLVSSGPRMGNDKDSEIFYVLALGHKMLGNDLLFMDCISKAIDLYPSSPYYLIQAVLWQLKKNRLSKASNLIKDFDPYIENIRQWGNPYGLYVYRLRDLSAEIEFRKGEISKAVTISKSNLESAKKNEFIISSHKARDFVSKDQLLQYLSARYVFFESQDEETSEEN